MPEIPNLTPSYINLKDKYKNEIEEIKNMGFDNEDDILKALFVSKGSVTIAINKLINKKLIYLLSLYKSITYILNNEFRSKKYSEIGKFVF